MRKAWLVFLGLVLLPLVAVAQYTVVLRDGRRMVAREKYLVDGGRVQFVGSDGQFYRLAMTEVDLSATEQANQREPQRPRKKVWTNDDLEQLRLRGRINIVGGQPAETTSEQKPAEAPTGETPAAGEAAAESEAPAEEAPKPLPPREQDPEYYRERLRPLRNELAQLERQITDLENTIRTGGGGRSGGVGLLQSNPGVDPRDTLARLRRQRDQLRAQMAGIEAEARRHGLSPGQLR